MKTIVMIDTDGFEFCSIPYTSEKEYQRMKENVPYVIFIIR